ncbi:MAG: glycosyltransferase family 2 protein [Gemmatimonadetes bacterium]|nr:glycosyltransferase family 2 protein [Gemmatimonadota bacterium]
MPLADRLDPSIKVSVVVPACNEEGNIPLLYERVRSVLEAEGCAFELIVVEDGSRDGTLEVLRQLSRQDRRVRYLSLSRNFGHQAAQLAGIEHSRGAAVITMDGDLQHPPETIPQMLEQWGKGFQVVNTRKLPQGPRGLVRRTLDATFYRLLSRLSGLEVAGSDFRLMDRRVAEVLVQLPERHKFLRGLVAWLGFEQTTIPYALARRARGESKYTFRKLLSLGGGFFGFSVLPLRLLSVFGLVAAIPALLYMFLVAGYGAYWLLAGDMGTRLRTLPPGWATLVVAIIFFGGVQLIGLGLVGEYLGRVYTEVKGRPVYVVKEFSDPPVLAADRTGREAQIRHEPVEEL